MSTDAPESRNTDSPTADGGQDEEPQVDPDVAAELARERLVQSLWFESQSSDVDDLVVATNRICSSLRDGEVPDNADLAHARVALRQIGERLDELSRLYELNRYQQDVLWENLSDKEKREIEACNEEGDDGGE